MPSLLEIAARSGVSFETSPSGRWVRFNTPVTPIYVVEGAWGNGYMVWSGQKTAPSRSEDGVQRFLRIEEAVSAALKLAS
ncbi:MAG: hypothetical protein ACYC4L_02700 [Chloroflexota bacterium]